MFSEDLKHARISLGISGREAAKRLGISSPYYSQLETGKRDMPKGPLLEKIEALMQRKFARTEPERLQAEREGECLLTASEFRKSVASIESRLDRLESILLDMLAALSRR